MFDKLCDIHQKVVIYSSYYIFNKDQSSIFKLQHAYNNSQVSHVSNEKQIILPLTTRQKGANVKSKLSKSWSLYLMFRNIKTSGLFRGLTAASIGWFLLWFSNFESNIQRPALEVLCRNLNKLVLKLRTTGKDKFIGQKVRTMYTEKDFI